MESVIIKYFEPIKLPLDLLLEIKYWCGIIIVFESEFTKLELSPTKSQYLSSYAHFDIHIGKIKVCHQLSSVYLHNFVTDWQNWWFISIKPLSIHTDSHIKLQVVGRVESYTKASGSQTEYQYYESNIDNEVVPWHLTHFILPGAPCFFLPSRLFKPKKFIKISLEFDKLKITGYASMRYIIFLYILYFYIYYMYIYCISEISDTKGWCIFDFMGCENSDAYHTALPIKFNNQIAKPTRQ